MEETGWMVDAVALVLIFCNLLPFCVVVATCGYFVVTTETVSAADYEYGLTFWFSRSLVCYQPDMLMSD